MAAVTEFAFDAFPGRLLRVALFTDVSNGSALIAQLTSGVMEPEAAFLNATVVVDAFALQVAAHRALAAAAAGRTTTRTLHSDLVFNLSPNNHITESLRRFGVGVDTRALLVARFDGSAEEMAAACAHVAGTAQPLSHLSSLTDTAALMKYFKPTPEELTCGSLADAIICRVAAKEVL